MLYRVYRAISRFRGAKVHLTRKAFNTVGPARAFHGVLFGAGRRRGHGAYHPARGTPRYGVPRKRK